MSETRAIKVESCEKCFKGKIYCVYRKELFRGSIHPNCPLPPWPSLSKKTIIKIRKKPIVIHAIQLNFTEGFEVTSTEGRVSGKPGDYLMFGVNGEKYICSKEVFEKTYGKIED